jgi:hypothetical protein
MQQEARRRLLFNAMRDAVIELARAHRARHGTAMVESIPGTIAISALDVFELLRPRIPNLTLDEVENVIMQSLPYMGERRE